MAYRLSYRVGQATVHVLDDQRRAQLSAHLEALASRAAEIAGELNVFVDSHPDLTADDLTRSAKVLVMAAQNSLVASIIELRERRV